MATSDQTIREFLLPDLGEGLTEGEIAAWLVEVGSVVEVDEPVAEVETAKAVVEIPSPFAGVVVRRHAEVGEEVEVGHPLISIDTDPKAGTGVDADRPAPATGTPTTDRGGADAAPGAPPEEAGQSDLVPESEPEPARGRAAADDDRAEATEGTSGNVLVGYGTGGDGRRRRRRGATGLTGPAGTGGRRSPARDHERGPVRGPDGRPLAKPPVRKMAKDLGVDLRDVEPSGPGGVITREDVEAAHREDTHGEAAAAEPDAAARRRAPVGDEVHRIPVTGVRRLIADKMTRSRREIPEATTWVDVDATELMLLRDDLNAAQGDVHVSPLAFIMRACVAGLRRHPELNARLADDGSAILLHRAVHLGFAAQTDRGLLVPVIADAQDKSTLEIASELAALAADARAGRLAPEQLSGSTFTVSNYGSFGVDGGAPVINHPEAAILGVGRIVPRPWVHADELAIRRVLQLSIAFDHRICDGGEAAGFLRFVADCVERPALLLASL